MPTFITSGKTSGKITCDNLTNSNMVIFLNDLTTKILNMSIAIDKRMNDLQNKVCSIEKSGFILASIETPKMAISVGLEYIEYVRRYGPPINGQFNTDKLRILRAELGV